MLPRARGGSASLSFSQPLRRWILWRCGNTLLAVARRCLALEPDCSVTTSWGSATYWVVSISCPDGPSVGSLRAHWATTSFRHRGGRRHLLLRIRPLRTRIVGRGARRRRRGRRGAPRQAASPAAEAQHSILGGQNSCPPAKRLRLFFLCCTTDVINGFSTTDCINYHHLDSVLD